MPRPFGSTITLDAKSRSDLESLVNAGSTPQALVLRCNVVLAAALPGDPSNHHVAEHLGCNRHTVGKWRERYAALGLQGLQDAPRSGRPRTFPPERERRRPGHRQ